MKYKTNKKHFDFFKERCEVWLKRLGLISWKIYYEHRILKQQSLGSCSTNYAGKCATLTLNQYWFDLPVTKEMLDENALHECLEILLSPLEAHAKDRRWDSLEYDNDHHAIIRTLEKVLKNIPDQTVNIIQEIPKIDLRKLRQIRRG